MELAGRCVVSAISLGHPSHFDLISFRGYIQIFSPLHCGVPSCREDIDVIMKIETEGNIGKNAFSYANFQIVYQAP